MSARTASYWFANFFLDAVGVAVAYFVWRVFGFTWAAFVVASLILVTNGRHLGWALSRKLLYRLPLGLLVPLCIIWGGAVSMSFCGLISWLHPWWPLKWVFGYAAGLYVACPNYGLFNEGSIPEGARTRHHLIGIVPDVSFVISSIALAFCGW